MMARALEVDAVSDRGCPQFSTCKFPSVRNAGTTHGTQILTAVNKQRRLSPASGQRQLQSHLRHRDIETHLSCVISGSI